MFVDSGTTLIHGPRRIIDAIYKQIEEECKNPEKSGRKCGGHRTLDWNTKCFDFRPNAEFPDLESYHESFPHVYLIFYPNAYIPIYPRDYFFLENGRQCFGFDYLEGKLILGGVFLRNYDVQFDRENQVVKIVRSNCSSDPNVNFEKFYLKHSDDRGFLDRPPVVNKEPTGHTQTTESKPAEPSGNLCLTRKP